LHNKLASYLEKQAGNNEKCTVWGKRKEKKKVSGNEGSMPIHAIYMLQCK